MSIDPIVAIALVVALVCHIIVRRRNAEAKEIRQRIERARRERGYPTAEEHARIVRNTKHVEQSLLKLEAEHRAKVIESVAAPL